PGAVDEVAADWAELDLPVVVTRYDRPPDELRGMLAGRVSAFLGHSGVGKSTLVNALVPEAERAVGEVSGVGKGRHTSSSAVALPLAGAGGWVIDTPGVRSFGLAHVTATEVVTAFADLAEAVRDCPRGCGHLGPPADPECALDELAARGGVSAGRLAALRRVLVALSTPSWS
ncbi:MAG: GTPase RsgA, partial [Pseudonocardia sp.]|nr:GTPase RsgA [Pseudonocardia sp.]